MTVKAFLGLNAFAWVALAVAAMTLLLLADALAGHYRSGFAYRVQYAPFLSGGLLIVSILIAVVMPEASWANIALGFAGWVAVATGVIGFVFHHYYGIAKKPGGYKWLLHHLMYGAPQLAPLALAMMGALILIAARGMAGEIGVAGFRLRAALFVVIAVGSAGAILQAGILHYRGSFNNVVMYGPLTAPLLAVISTVWALFSPGPASQIALASLLWLTFLTGFVGLGMHLRGLDRQMGGLYVWLFSLLEGPPAWAPALFTGFAAVGLIAIYLI